MNVKRMWLVVMCFFFVAALGFSAGQQEGAAAGEDEMVDMTVIFPRSLEVLDDYYLNTAFAMGYFADEGINAHAEGALGTTDSSKLVAQGQGEAALPAPPVLMTAVAQGLPLTMVFEQDKNYIFAFGVRKDSDIDSVEDLKGKTISVGDAGWTVIMDPLFKKVAGFTSDDVEVVVGGTGRAQLVQEGKADAVFTWEKEYQLWRAQGIELEIISGYDAGVRFPGNGIVFADDYIEMYPERVIGFSRAWAKGIYFGEVNPAAATQITLEKYPMIGVDFEEALKAIKAGVWVMTAGPVVEEHGLGYMDTTHWNEMMEILYEQEVLPDRVDAADFLTNEFIDEINNFDKAAVEADARAYELSEENKEVLDRLNLNEYGWD